MKGLCFEGPRRSDVQVVFWGDDTAENRRGGGLSATRVRRVTAWAPHHFQPQEEPAERASRCLYVSRSLPPFPHFPSLFSSSCLTLYTTRPSSPSSSSFTHSQRLCPQNYPDSSLKRSAWNHQITMERGKKKQREEKALREMSSFYSFSMSLPQSHKCVHIFCIPPFR